MTKIEEALFTIDMELRYMKDMNQKEEEINRLKKFYDRFEDIRLKFYKELIDNYEYCEVCKKWLPKNNFKSVVEKIKYKDEPITYNEIDIRKMKFIDRDVEKEYHVCSICGDVRCVKTTTIRYIINGKSYEMNETKGVD